MSVFLEGRILEKGGHLFFDLLPLIFRSGSTSAHEDESSGCNCSSGYVVVVLL